MSWGTSSPSTQAAPCPARSRVTAEPYACATRRGSDAEGETRTKASGQPLLFLASRALRLSDVGTDYPAVMAKRDWQARQQRHQRDHGRSPCHAVGDLKSPNDGAPDTRGTGPKLAVGPHWRSPEHWDPDAGIGCGNPDFCESEQSAANEQQ